MSVEFWPLEHGETPGRGKLGATHKERTRKVNPVKLRRNLLRKPRPISEPAGSRQCSYASSLTGGVTVFQSPVVFHQRFGLERSSSPLERLASIGWMRITGS